MIPAQISQDAALAALRRQWAAVALAGSTALTMVYLLLASTWEPVYAGRWALLALLVFLILLRTLWAHLGENHHPDNASLLPTLGIANLISLLRGLLLAMLAGFLFSPWPSGWLAWLPGALYTAAIALDYADGLTARLTHRITVLGSTLDISLDGLGVLIAPLVAIWYGQLPIWYLAVGAARYLFLGGIGLRKRLGMPVRDLPPSALRRALAGVQFGFISAILWPLFKPPATWVGATAFMVPFLAGFVRDWLIVSTVIDPTSPRYRQALRTFVEITRGWAAPILRGVVLCAATWLGMRALSISAPVVLPALMAISTLFVACGLLGRIASLALLIVIGLHMSTNGVEAAGALIAVSATFLLFTGTGRFSLWAPEDAFLIAQYGREV